ncbi:regucalcin-like [Papilio machaon]|uniref:regucalcin-like n=1 Tax=Papilio machaon TaxID=76193 RepID=UPI001E663390|nr:regucalcin-like [Papilio machaon]
MAPVTEAVLTISFGEGPHWDVDEQVLYFVNYTDNTINKYNPATRERTCSEFDDHVSFIIPIEGKKHHFLCGMKRNIVEIEWNGENDTARIVRIVAQVDKDKPINMFNDGKADPRGRLYTGTLGFNDSGSMSLESFVRENGSIYRLDEDGQIHELDGKITLANGLAWDIERKYFYYVDSMDGIRRYDYDIETGNISNCKKIFVAAEHGFKGLCDGMTIDTDGNLWVALMQSSKVNILLMDFNNCYVIKIEGETGKLLQKVTIPTNEVTSVAFGGPNLDILYVTTANTRCKKNEPAWGAALYEVTGLGVRGHPSTKVKIN